MLGEPGGHLHEGEKPAGGLTNLFSQEKKEKTTTVYEMEEAWMLKKKTVRRSMWRWRCLWDRVSDLCAEGHLHGDEQPAIGTY